MGAPNGPMATADVPYTKGVRRIGPDVWAWLAPNGSWGWSNAGLVAGCGESLLVDTLFDLSLTRELLAALDPVTAERSIRSAVNTHANGDHCYGNQLLADDVIIYAAREMAEELAEDADLPDRLHRLVTTDFGPELTPYLRERFGPFRFDDIELRPPDQVFDDRLTVAVGDRPVELIKLGPAHTEGDVVVHVPDAGVLFAGDLLFIGGTPLMWAGPVGGWIDACDRMIEFDAPVIVPGHGPVTDADGVREVQAYLRHVEAQARAAHAAGWDAVEAAFRVDLDRFADLPDADRVVITMAAIYTELDPEHSMPDTVTLFGRMARWHAERG